MRMKRGAVWKKEARMITLWIPNVLLPVIDRAVVNHDTDRAKYIRQAIREKLIREGVPQFQSHEES
jgi:metal-responsive CopG/Arc/MetJ family transcriptional regulator